MRKAFSEKDAKVCESIFLETLTKCNDGDPVTNQPQAALSKETGFAFLSDTFPYPAPPPPSTSSTTFIIVSYKCRKSKKEEPVKIKEAATSKINQVFCCN